MFFSLKHIAWLKELGYLDDKVDPENNSHWVQVIHKIQQQNLWTRGLLSAINHQYCLNLNPAERRQYYETLAVLDQNGKYRGGANWKLVHEAGLIHAGVSVWLVKSDGKVFVAKRSSEVEGAGLWDIACGGKVPAANFGQRTILKTAVKEMEQELFDRKIYKKPDYINRVYFEKLNQANKIRCFHHNFMLEYSSEADIPFKPNSEIKELAWVALEELSEWETVTLFPTLAAMRKNKETIHSLGTIINRS